MRRGRSSDRMHLVQILLPLYDNDGRRQPDALFHRVRQELVDRFGGLTAYSRAPAKGLWQDESGSTTPDEIIVHEVMAEQIDVGWWREYWEGLERDFRQEEIVIRAQVISKL